MRFSSILLTLLLALAGVSAFAQPAGSLAGVVLNPQGEAVGGARVALMPVGSSAAPVTVETSPAGVFTFQTLRPAVYDITVEAAGFASRTVKAVMVSAEAGTLAPIRLIPGPSYGASAAGPRPTNLSLLATTGRELADALPLPQAQAAYLLDLLPGVQNNGRAPMAVYGESASLGQITYDGINVQKSFPQINGAGLSLPDLRSGQVAEASIVAGDISGCGCTRLEFAAPTGSNGFHGSARWLVQPAGLAAQYWRDNSAGLPASRGINQIGASLVGSLRRNRLFYFADYEGAWDRSRITRTGPAPMRPLTSRDPLLQKVLALVPASANGRYSGWQNDGGTQHAGLARLDYTPSGRHALGLTFLDSSHSTDDPADSSIYGAVPSTTIHVAPRTFSAFWRWSPHPRVTNELRAGGTLTRFRIENAMRGQFDFLAVLRDPNVDVSQPMAGLDPQRRDDSQYGLQDDVTWTAGKHAVQGGFWFQRYRLESNGVDQGTLDSGAVPRYTVSDVSEGLVSRASRRFSIASPSSGYGSAPVASTLSTQMISGYLHDSWKLFQPLTVSAGVRFDWLAPAHVRRGAAIIPDYSATPSDSVYDKTLPFLFASTRPFYRNDLTNYALYVGLAWKPARSLPIVVRGAANLSSLNDRLLANMSFLALENPFQNFEVAADLSGAPAALSSRPAVAAPAAPSEWSLASLQALANRYGQEPGPVYGVNPNLATPNIKYWNLGVEAQAKGFSLDVRYLGNLLEEGARSVDRNQVMVTRNGFLNDFQKVRSDLLNGVPTNGFPLLRGGGLCSNFSLQNCQPDLYARSLILTGQAGELGRWYESRVYGENVYNLLGNPLASGGINVMSHMGVSRYDAVQFRVSRNAGAGLNVQASYIFSKVMSNLNDYRPGAVDPYLDFSNPSIEWAPAPFNLTHAFKAAFVEQLPFPAGSARTLPGRILSGWSMAATVIAQSGAPFSLLSGGYVTMPDGEVVAVSGLGTLTSLADSGQNTVSTSLDAPQIRSYLGVRKSGNGVVSYVNAPGGAFRQPAPGTIGNLQRRMFSGPGALNLNLGVRKSIPLKEQVRAEFRAESINLLNGVSWLVRDQTLLGSQFSNDVTQWNAPRSIQFSLRLIF